MGRIGKTNAEVFQQIVKEENSVGKWECLLKDCHNTAINSHLLQRHGILDNITEDGHMYELSPISAFRLLSPSANNNDLILEFKKIGINNAISWPIFCNKHDTLLFSDIEKKELDCSDYSNQLLFSYRTVCGEIRKNEILCQIYTRYLNEGELSPQKIMDIRDRIRGLKQTINDYRFYENEIQKELLNPYGNFVFRHYSYNQLKIYASAAFSYILYDKEKEYDPLPWECCFFHIIPQPRSSEIIVGYHKDRVNSYLIDYAERWNNLDNAKLEQMLSDFCTLRAEGWGLSVSLYNKIGREKKKEFLSLFQTLGHCYDARVEVKHGIFEGLLQCY